MITRKTSADFATDLENAILSRNSNHDVKIGPIPDLVIKPLSGVLERQNERIRAVQQLLSLINDGSFSNSDLDSFVYNELLLRLSGSTATVTLVFSRAATPTSNVTVRANFPVATLADEVTGTSVTFMTLADATLDYTNAGAYFNSTTQRYELQIPAKAVVGSSSGNVASNRIIRPLRPLNGFDTVFNRDPSVNGQDGETNSQLIERFFISLLGTSPSVVNGIEKILRDQFSSVTGSNVVYGNNPLNVRAATDGGAVDVYVIGSSPATFTENIVFPGANQVIPLTDQPILNLVSATGFVQGVDFVLVKDTSGYAGSVRGLDGIKWLTTGSLPAIGATVPVTYSYNSLISLLQAAFTDPAKVSPGRDLLFKAATQTNLTLSANIKINTGFNVASVVQAVQTAILALINNSGLGDLIEVSNLQATVRSFSAVSNFIVTNLAPVGGTGTVDIQMGPDQFARMNAVDLTLTVI